MASTTSLSAASPMWRSAVATSPEGLGTCCMGKYYLGARKKEIPVAAPAASHVPSEWRECTQTLVHRQQLVARRTTTSLPKSTHKRSIWIYPVVPVASARARCRTVQQTH